MRIEVSAVRLPEFGTEAVVPELPISEYRARLEQVDRARRRRGPRRARRLRRSRARGQSLLPHRLRSPFRRGAAARRRPRRTPAAGRQRVPRISPGPGARLSGGALPGVQFDGTGARRVAALATDSLRLRHRNWRAGGMHRLESFRAGLVDNPGQAIEIPAFIVDVLRSLTGATGLVRNATGLLMDPRSGLRIVSGVDQLARFEFASIQTSESIKALIAAIREGVSEVELERCYRGAGLPLSCHPMVSVGEKARRGLSSPSSRRARRGEPFTAAYGIQGAMTCRAGMIASGPGDLHGRARGVLSGVRPQLFCHRRDVVSARGSGEVGRRRGVGRRGR